MAVQNSLTTQNNTAAPAQKPQKMALTAYLNQDSVLANISQALGETNKQRFVTSIISAVNANPMIKDCTNQSILVAALLGETLKLSPSPQLGHFYFVPYSDKNKVLGKDENGYPIYEKTAQFQLGYKGYIQLAIRSGQYKKINVIAIKKGELKEFNPLDETIDVAIDIEHWDERENAETVGYYAMFELVNGFRKAIYWSKKQMKNHAYKYSPGYKKDLEKGWKNTFWSKDFDGMAYKTLIRQLISKWGVMSIDMQKAFENDIATENYASENNYSEIAPIPDPEPPVTDAKSALFGNGEPETLTGEII